MAKRATKHHTPTGTAALPERVLDIKAIGVRVRATRLASNIDQATAAGLAGVGIRFLGDLERGRPNLRVALVLQVLHRLGLELWIAPRGWHP